MNYVQTIKQLVLFFRYLIVVRFATADTALLLAGSFSRTMKVYALYVLKLSLIANSLSPFILFGAVTPLQASAVAPVGDIFRASDQQSEEVQIDYGRSIKKYTLEEKYRVLAGGYFYQNVVPYLPLIDTVLTEKGLEDNAYFIQVMFFIGQHESHWNTHSVSSFNVGGEHPTGIFQFLPSTFRSVSNGNIFDAEDQIRAFITMVERGRVDEFATLFIPGINPYARAYMLRYR